MSDTRDLFSGLPFEAFNSRKKENQDEECHEYYYRNGDQVDPSVKVVRKNKGDKYRKFVICGTNTQVYTSKQLYHLYHYLQTSDRRCAKKAGKRRLNSGCENEVKSSGKLPSKKQQTCPNASAIAYTNADAIANADADVVAAVAVADTDADASVADFAADADTSAADSAAAANAAACEDTFIEPPSPNFEIGPLENQSHMTWIPNPWDDVLSGFSSEHPESPLNSECKRYSDSCFSLPDQSLGGLFNCGVTLFSQSRQGNRIFDARNISAPSIPTPGLSRNGDSE